MVAGWVDNLLSNKGSYPLLARLGLNPVGDK
jgi:hypothetical protein